MPYRKLVFFLWLCFVARGIFYCAIIPIWEGFDEPSHFSFLQYVVANHKLPLRSDRISREVEASLHRLPISWEQRLHSIAPPVYTEDTYWQLPEAQRRSLQAEFQSLPPSWAAEPGSGPLYEAQQPPLYYWVFSLPLRWSWGWSLAERVMLLRMLGIFAASLFIPLGFLVGRRFFGNDGVAVAAMALIVCMPELMINLARVSNESLAIVIYTLVLLLLMRSFQDPAKPRTLSAAGLALGAGLLTKAYFLTTVPAFLSLAFFFSLQRPSERKRIVLWASFALILALAISFPWYWRNHVLTGSLSGEANDTAASHILFVDKLGALIHVNWIGGIISVLLSHVWFGGWSFLKLPKWMYVAAGAVMAVPIFGLIESVWNRICPAGKARNRTPYATGISVLGVVYGFFWLGLLYHIFATYLALGISASTGWYLYALVVAEILLVCSGILALTPQRWQGAAIPALAAALATIDLYGVHALLVPYYTGVIAHVAGSEIVHPASILQLLHAGSTVVLGRLATNKPALFSPAAFAFLFAMYYVATATTVVVGWLALRPASPSLRMTVPKNLA